MKSRKTFFLLVFILITSFSYAQEWNKIVANGVTWYRIKEDGKYGAANANKRIIVPIQYDWVGYGRGYYYVTQNSKVGVISAQGKMIIPPCYYNINYAQPINGKDFFYVTENGKHGLVDSNNMALIPIKYDYVSFSPLGEFIKIKDNEYEGAYSYSGKLIVPPIYDKVYYYADKGFEVSKPLGGYKKLHIDHSGNKLPHVPEIIDPIKEYKNGDTIYYITYRGGFYGVKNAGGEEIIPTIYDDVRLRNNFYFVQKGDKVGCCTTDGTIIIPPSFDRIKYTNSYFIVKDGRKKGLLNTNGETIIEPIYEDLDVNNGFIVYKENGKKGLQTLSKEQILEASYDEVYPRKDYILVVNQYKKGVFSLSGEEIIPVKYKNIQVNEGELEYQDDNGRYIASGLDTYGKPVKKKRDNIKLMKDYSGYEWYRLYENNLYGVANENGDIIIPAQYDNIEYHYGYFLIKSNNLEGVATLDGSILIEPKFYDIYRGGLGKGDFFYVKKDILYTGVYALDGKLLVEPQYMNIDIHEGKFCYKHDDGYWYSLGVYADEARRNQPLLKGTYIIDGTPYYIEGRTYATPIADMPAEVEIYENHIIVNGCWFDLAGTNRAGNKVFRNSKSQQYIVSPLYQMEYISNLGFGTFVYQMYLQAENQPAAQSYTSFYVPADVSSSSYSSSSNHSSSSNSSVSIRVCHWCKGTGRVAIDDSAGPSYGVKTSRRTCTECGRVYDPTIFIHRHATCSHCHGTGTLN